MAGELMTALFGFVILFGLCVMWPVLTTIGVIRYRTYLISLIAPILVLGFLAGVGSGFVETAGWRVSKGPMERAAANCADADRGLYGVYLVHSVEERNRGCLFTTNNYTDGAEVGYAYFPNGVPSRGSEPPGISHLVYEPFEGPWHKVFYHS